MEQLLCAVDMFDNALYEITKEEAHKKGILHRAFSVIIFYKDKLLIQRRAFNKYHCGGLWSNACCSHPGMNEVTECVAKRRLTIELGIKEITLRQFGSITYYCEFPNGLKEYEYDYIYLGEYNGEVKVNEEEISEVKWISISELVLVMQKEPEIFTPWFIIIFAELIPYFMKREESCE